MANDLEVVLDTMIKNETALLWEEVLKYQSAAEKRPIVENICAIQVRVDALKRVKEEVPKGYSLEQMRVAFQ